MRGSLNVTPGANSYGGQQVVFAGDMGRGQQRIVLQRRGCPSCVWSDVIDPRSGKPFSRLTQRNGEFDFTFPAPAMNAVYFRLHSRKADTSAHQFKTVHQDAEIFIVEESPADVPLPRGFAVSGEPYHFKIDTVRVPSGPKRPALVGRRIEFQQRNESTGAWAFEAQANLGADGLVSFAAPAPDRSASGVYRVVLDDWTKDGDNVGWFPSLPFYLEVVDRPQPVRTLDAVETASSVTLSWTLPADPERDKIVIARTEGYGAPQPSAGNPRHILATIPGGSTSYADNTVFPSWTYKYAVYTVSDDGVYTELPQRVTTLTPDSKRGES